MTSDTHAHFRHVPVPNGRGGILYIRFSHGSKSWGEIESTAIDRYGPALMESLVIGVGRNTDPEPALYVTTEENAHHLFLCEQALTLKFVFDCAELYSEETKIPTREVMIIPKQNGSVTIGP